MQDISRDVLTRAAGGDLAAFEEIYRAASGFVYGIAFRITGSREDTEEVTQDVFLKIHEHLKDFRFGSSFRTWAYRITVNTAVNVYRRNKRLGARRADFEPVAATAVAPDGTEERLEKADRERLVTGLLAGLNPEQRACVVLREIEGLSYREIAETLKINLNTVRSRLKRARLTLVTRGKEAIKNEL